MKKIIFLILLVASISYSQSHTSFADSSRGWWGGVTKLEKHLCRYIVIYADRAISDTLYVGDTISAKGKSGRIQLRAGEWLRLPVTNTALIGFIGGSVGANKIRYYWEY